MKTSKTYHLAHHVNNHSPYKKIHSHLQSLPSYIKEEEASHRFIPSQKQENIFAQQNPTQLKKIDLNSQENYKFVGIRQLRSYQSRAEKKKRNLNSFNKRPSDTAMSISRVSSTKTLQHSYLTKEELVKKVFAAKESPYQKGDEVFLEEKNSFLLQTLAQMNITASTHKTKENSYTCSLNNQCINKSSSLTRIKGIRKKYENQWQGLINNRAILQKQSKTHKKYQSVLENVVSFRQNIEKKEIYDQIEKTVHVKPNQWNLILRSQNSLRSLHQKELSHASAKGIKIVGLSKCAKEVEWVQKLDKQGCFFKWMVPDKADKRT